MQDAGSFLLKAASTSLGSLLEMQSQAPLQSYGITIYILKRSPGDLDACYSVRRTGLENMSVRETRGI